MPKREPTPELEDDFKYFVVNYPYPLHARMDSISERHELAHWIASCIGKDDLTAVYYKPSAPNMIIIEVIKACPKINAFLGAHKWHEFLRNPEPSQINNESRVYYCRYGSGRDVEKHGWKRLYVEDAWFKDFDPIDGPFVTNPYPKTSFCEVPPETKTDYGLCRPLPTDVFPRLKPSNKQNIVPGSDVYVKSKEAATQSIAAPVPVKKASVKTWAGVVSPSNSVAHDLELERPSKVSIALSGGSGLMTSSVEAIGLPPGLGSPPGLSINVSQTSSESSFPAEGLSSPTSSTHRTPTIDDIASEISATVIEDQQNSHGKSGDNEDEEPDLWADQPERRQDWEKPICPVHEVSCRVGVCSVMDAIVKKKKREQKKDELGQQNQGDGDGWSSVKPRGRGRGGARGQVGGRRGYSRGNGFKNIGGGWA
ncbi:uncharacterized protein FOMMEDRAFT_16648 [Fomitiporia mediterranea MF3/22]|uniref:uncharacterized protein n=1 Tax=Fomitiporia mediterranea (strain MF3/22) TaxID=694068 RepID=UPI00044075B5|nr:uncharacterized protein FOMMEDRAFT_16648 [Fomitiporia mediterranea MF3/22]EJD08189.1 hypothetical protein FOMMEDRAFT_16648 [Fomitiporia mediterranea MF3/22]